MSYEPQKTLTSTYVPIRQNKIFLRCLFKFRWYFKLCKSILIKFLSLKWSLCCLQDLSNCAWDHLQGHFWSIPNANNSTPPESLEQWLVKIKKVGSYSIIKRNFCISWCEWLNALISLLIKAVVFTCFPLQMFLQLLTTSNPASSLPLLLLFHFYFWFWLGRPICHRKEWQLSVSY